MSELVQSSVDRIRKHLIGLKMPRALETLQTTLGQIEQGEVSALAAIEALLGEELTTRESRRIKMALMTARLSNIKTIAGYDFSFQPSLAETGSWPWPNSNLSIAASAYTCWGHLAQENRISRWPSAWKPCAPARACTSSAWPI